jgi:hypothetical protein
MIFDRGGLMVLLEVADRYMRPVLELDCGKNSMKRRVRALKAAEKVCFVSGHDFSRAVNN